MKKQIFTAVRVSLVFTIITGIIYPLGITLFSNIFFTQKAAGSLIEKEGHIIGSELISQKFTGDKYFWARPSAIDYNPLPSGASNLSLTSAALKKNYDERKKYFLDKNFLNSNHSIPEEMLFSSASGADPHISGEAAYLQVNRIAKARNFDEMKINKLKRIIESSIRNPQLGIFGKTVVNVLLLNLELDRI